MRASVLMYFTSACRLRRRNPIKISLGAALGEQDLLGAALECYREKDKNTQLHGAKLYNTILRAHPSREHTDGTVVVNNRSAISLSDDLWTTRCAHDPLLMNNAALDLTSEIRTPSVWQTSTMPPCAHIPCLSTQVTLC